MQLDATSAIPLGGLRRAISSWRPDPFLHIEPQRLFNPLTDKSLVPGDAGYGDVREAALGGGNLSTLEPALREQLATAGWLVEDSPDLSSRFRLKYVSLEAHTACNQGCYFCPVAEHPRDAFFMPLDFYEEIVRQLAEFKDTIEGVSMIHYNEPTIDKRFVEQVGLLHKYGLPPAVLTNATGLTPSRVDAIMAMGGLKFLSINLSTLDRERYSADRQGDHLKVVLKNLDYVKNVRLAPTMEIAVLGRGDEDHKRDHVEISELFAGSNFDIKYYEVMNRAGNVSIGHRPSTLLKGLCGCEQTGSRPVQWVHITPHGKAVLCCQDYFDRYVVGDLHEESLRDILSGPQMSLMRRWVYGMEEAPADFICRSCVYALTR
jgi:hypothetical protein